jgi:3-deoxy-D-manno-octulosonate 8-phosphate phosphatase KdsC-like HAD superfamily phosphatase
MKKKSPTPTHLIIDVDGVMTTGQFFYTADGKAMKVFGADDNDALSLLNSRMKIRFVTGDKKGFAISKRRIWVLRLAIFTHGKAFEVGFRYAGTGLEAI